MLHCCTAAPIELMGPEYPLPYDVCVCVCSCVCVCICVCPEPAVFDRPVTAQVPRCDYITLLGTLGT